MCLFDTEVSIEEDVSVLVPLARLELRVRVAIEKGREQCCLFACLELGFCDVLVRHRGLSASKRT